MIGNTASAKIARNILAIKKGIKTAPSDIGAYRSSIGLASYQK